MKKITSILLIAAILCCSVILFASCDDDTHTHSYGSWSITKAASCESAGSRSKSCSCGDTVTETIAALGHNYVGGVCTDCGKSE